ncbi:MAG: penicillin acylase family protein [Pseudomonadota bacterium]
MKRILKWAFAVVATLVVLAAIVLGAAWLIGVSSIPKDSGSLQLAVLSAPAKVTRDANGVPHISGANRADVAAALGFTHAQDRLWQMEILRRSGQGRLSELFGRDALDVDKFLRSLGFADQAASSFKLLKPENQKVLESYAAGVNAYLAQDTGLLESRLSPEFLILGHTPEPWEAYQSLLVLKVMSLQLSMNMDRELKRLSLAAEGLSPAEINDIMPMHRDENPGPLPDLRTWLSLTAPAPEAKAKADSAVAFIENALVDNLGKWASNNWVISGDRTESGKPLLANDPHLGFSAPSLWYLTHLNWTDETGRDIQVVGATIPSLPAVILGHNTHVAWGFTNAGADVQDIFIEKVNPDNSEQYRTPDGWAAFEVMRDDIQISDGTTEAFERKRTRHGVVLPGSFRSLGEILPENHVAALSWPGLSASDKSFDVLSGLAFTRSVDEFQTAIAGTVSPMQAMVAADKDGNIGLFAPATVPTRALGNLAQGRLPVAGWLAVNDWTGEVPRDRLPAAKNPISGAFGTANSRFLDQAPSDFLTFDWDEPFRHDRVQNLIVRSNQKHNVESMIAGQMDTRSEALLELRDILVQTVEKDARFGGLLRRLEEWDGLMSADRPEPLIMTVFHRTLMKNVFADDLKTAEKAVYTASATSLLRVLTQGGARKWCDELGTETEESCSTQISDAFAATIEELQGEFGSSVGTWKWGDKHVLYGEHTPFSKVWPLSEVFTVQRAASGGNYALQRGKTDFEDEEHPYRSVHGAGYRAIYDFADLDASLFVQSSGQSGHVFSPRYDDLIRKWVKGEYIRISTDPEDFEQGALGTWTLNP